MKTLITTDGEESKYIRYQKKYKSVLPLLSKKPNKRILDKFNSMDLDSLNLHKKPLKSHTERSNINQNSQSIRNIFQKNNEKLNYKTIEFIENESYKDMSRQINNAKYFLSDSKIKKNKSIFPRNKSESHFNAMNTEDIQNLIKLVRERIELKSNDNNSINAKPRVNQKLFLREIESNNYFDLILEKILHKIELKNSKNKFISDEYVNKIIYREIEKIISKNNQRLDLTRIKLPLIKSEMTSRNTSKDITERSNFNKSHIETIGEESDLSLDNSRVYNPIKKRYSLKKRQQEEFHQLKYPIDSLNNERDNKNQDHYKLNSIIDDKIIFNKKLIKKVLSKLTDKHHLKNIVLHEIVDSNYIKFIELPNSNRTKMEEKTTNMNTPVNIGEKNFKASLNSIQKTKEEQKIDFLKIKINSNNPTIDYNSQNEKQKEIKKSNKSSSSEKEETIIKNELLNKPMITNISNGLIVLDKEAENKMKQSMTNLLNKFRITTESVSPSKTLYDADDKIKEVRKNEEAFDDQKKVNDTKLKEKEIKNEKLNKNKKNSYTNIDIDVERSKFLMNKENESDNDNNEKGLEYQSNNIEYDKNFKKEKYKSVRNSQTKIHKKTTFHEDTRYKDEPKKRATIDRTDRRETIDRTDRRETIDRTDRRETIDRTDRRETIDRTDRRETIDRTYKRETIDKIFKGETNDKIDKRESIDKIDKINSNKKIREKNVPSILKSDQALLKTKTITSQNLSPNNKLVNNGDNYQNKIESNNKSSSKNILSRVASKIKVTIKNNKQNMKVIPIKKDSITNIINMDNTINIDNINSLQTKIEEKAEVIPEIKSEEKKFVLSLDFFKAKKQGKLNLDSREKNTREEFTQRGRERTKTRTKTTKIILFDDLEEVDKTSELDTTKNDRHSISNDILAIRNKVSHQSIDLEGLLKYKNITENLKVQVHDTNQNVIDKEKDNKIFELLELIKQQEDIKKRKLEEKKNLMDKYFPIKTNSNRRNSIEFNYMKDKIKSQAELQEEVDYKKKAIILKYKVDQTVQQNEFLSEELRKKKEQTYLLNVNQDLDFFLSKVQTGDDQRKYHDLVEKMQSLRNYDAENFIKNITEIYKNFKYEEFEIQNSIKIEERMNNFFNLLADYRIKNKNIKKLRRSELKCVDAKFETVTGPILN